MPKAARNVCRRVGGLNEEHRDTFCTGGGGTKQGMSSECELVSLILAQTSQADRPTACIIVVVAVERFPAEEKLRVSRPLAAHET